MNTLITIFGIVLILAPYALVFKSDNKLEGFLSVFTYTTLTSISVSIILQSLHIFNYYSVLLMQLMIVGYGAYLFRDGKEIHFDNLLNRIKSLRTFLFPIGFFVLAVYFLLSVHFNYTGFVDTVFGLQKVSHSSYTYPLYSDEWISASFIDYSVRTGSLPLANTLNADSLFPNFLFVSHSFFAHIVVLLGLEIVSNYIYFAILNTLLICVAVYLILRQLRVRATISAVTAFSVLLLTNSGNLPGLWLLLPYSVSLMFLLYSILSHLVKLEKISLINIVIALMIYPPMLVFIIPIWLAYRSVLKYQLKQVRFLLYISMAGVFLFALMFISKGFSLIEIFEKVFSYIIRKSLDQGTVYYAPWNIMPVYMTPFVIFGLFITFKQKIKTLVYPITVGLFFWILYCFADTVYLIEPARVVVVTSVLMVIASGLGLEKFYTYVQHKAKNTFLDITDPVLDIGIKILVLAFFVFWTINIGKFGQWHRFPLYIERNIINSSGVIKSMSQKLFPAPPITRYLHDEDLELFSNYSEKKFISPKWKGLVLGVATHNYPLDSKPSMITNNILSYDVFSSAVCEQKQKYIDMYKIDLVYSASTTCAGFKEIGKTSENLHLYLVTQNSKKVHNDSIKKVK